jgi:hypothetical protein
MGKFDPRQRRIQAILQGRDGFDEAIQPRMTLQNMDVEEAIVGKVGGKSLILVRSNTA